MALLAAAATQPWHQSRRLPRRRTRGRRPFATGRTTTPSPDAKKAKAGAGSAGSDAGAKEADELTDITVVGVRQSQIRAIELKRDAASIQDSIRGEHRSNCPT